jgi:hypothetical protein
MAKKSSFKLAQDFAQSIQVRADAIQRVAQEAMAEVMAQAEQDAQQLYRWRDPGYYSETDAGGDTWTWRVTGATAASITGYVVGNKQLKASNPGQRTIITRESNHGPDKAYEHFHGVDPSLTGDYSERPGVIQGIATMYTAYAPFLQMKEIAGGHWGQPSPGNPVTIEVLEVYWDAVYVPLLERLITQRMDRYGR